MGSAAKFWPRALFNLSVGKKEPSSAFVPATDIAARIIGGAQPKALSPAPEPPAVTSLDDLDFTGEAPSLEAETEPDLSRQAERFVPDKTSTMLTDKRGKSLRARIINLSATGVAVEADFRAMPVDTVAMVGAKPVTSGRTIRGGQVFIFDKPLDPARCTRQIVL